MWFFLLVIYFFIIYHLLFIIHYFIIFFFIIDYCFIEVIFVFKALFKLIGQNTSNDSNVRWGTFENYRPFLIFFNIIAAMVSLSGNSFSILLMHHSQIIAYCDWWLKGRIPYLGNHVTICCIVPCLVSI